MSIDDEDLGSEGLTENRQLQLFTDRYEFTRLFASYLNDDPPRKSILYFCGDGGNGKSLLLKFLQTFCSKRFFSKTWEQLKLNRNDRVVAEFIKNAKFGENCTAIPAVWHDFGLPPRGENQPQDPVFGLLMLRRNISEASPQYKFKFPLFDFACFWYLLNQGESPESIKRLFPEDFVGVLTPVIESMAGFPLVAQGVAILKLIDKFGGKERLKELVRQKLKLSKERVEEICRQDIDTELIFELPKLLGEDLTAAMMEKDLQVHPFYLGLCADVVLIERQQGITLQAADFAVIGCERMGKGI